MRLRPLPRRRNRSGAMRALLWALLLPVWGKFAIESLQVPLGDFPRYSSMQMSTDYSVSSSVVTYGRFTFYLRVVLVKSV